MIGSDLHKPLFGSPLRQRRVVPGLITLAACGLVFGAAGAALTRDGGFRGEPFAVGSITLQAADPASVERQPPAAASEAPATAALTAGPSPAPPVEPASQHIAVENGVTVVRGMAPGAAGPQTLRVPQPAQPRAGLRPPDSRLIEVTASGPLPRIGRDGLRPAEAYAAAPVPAEGKPRIAILIGGMGLDRTATIEAAAKLPPAATFGFAPYGDGLDEQARRVREAGHEIVLQMPMEGFGAQEPPLPHMLKVDDSENAGRLRWLLGRFAGYAGVGNYLGGRLLADEGSLKPLLQDLKARGLSFVDDGTAPRSLAPAIARDIGLPSAKADVVLDAAADPAAIGLALARLETLARQRGAALGTATARPATIAALARFMAGAEKRGIVIVPLSQTMRTDISRAAELSVR